MRVLVTGGARRLGGAIARACAAAGHEVVIHYRSSRDEAEALAAEIGAAGIVAGELGHPDASAELFERARKSAGGAIGGLVNSASTFAFDRPEAIDAPLAARLHMANCMAPAMLAAALAAQPELDEGAVVNLLDQKVANLNPDFFSYTLSKIALEGATTMLAQALAPKVRVNAVSPGLTLPSGDQSAAEFDAVARANLLQRPVGAEAIADAVVWLLDARSVTGQNLFVDCGQRFLKRDGDVMFESRPRD
jgi:NAD(P)-dependent dehydrogenase (short-subunit alcohol dehydrogenase family)